MFVGDRTHNTVGWGKRGAVTQAQIQIMCAWIVSRIDAEAHLEKAAFSAQALGIFDEPRTDALTTVCFSYQQVSQQWITTVVFITAPKQKDKAIDAVMVEVTSDQILALPTGLLNQAIPMQGLVGPKAHQAQQVQIRGRANQQ